jgi:hypothetical protein
MGTLLETWISTFRFDIAVGVMVLYIILDALYASYTLHVTKLNPVKAANTAASMYFLSALGVVSYVNNPLYLIPLAVGSWLGTYVIVKREKAKQ